MSRTSTWSSVQLAVAGLAVLSGACGGEDGPCSPRAGTLCSVAGSGVAGFNGDGRDALETHLYLPQDVTEGPDGHFYLTDWNNHRVRRLRSDGTVDTVAGTGLLGDGPVGPALEADFNHPTEVVFDRQGRMLIAAWHNSRIKRVDLTTGLLEDICGTGARAYNGDGGPAKMAVLDLPASLVFDSQGNTLVMDQANQVIRRIDGQGIISTVAGQCIVGSCQPGETPVMCPGSNKLACGGVTPEICASACKPGFAGDGAVAVALRMSQPFGQAADPAGRLAIDRDDNLYFADSRNHRIRRIGRDGTVTTVAGNGTVGSDGDGGPATEAQLNSPTDIELASDGTLYIADTQNSCVRAVSPGGTISTLLGRCGERGFAGDGGDLASVRLDRPYGIELDREGNLYVVDTYNHRIRQFVRP